MSGSMFLCSMFISGFIRIDCFFFWFIYFFVLPFLSRFNSVSIRLSYEFRFSFGTADASLMNVSGVSLFCLSCSAR